MEGRIKERYTGEIRDQALARFGGSHPEDIGGFESYILKFQKEGTEFVLRLAHSIRRTGEMIQGEVQWIRFLAENGVSVADAVESLSGNLVEEIPDGKGGRFLATAFTMIKGKTPWEYGWNTRLFTDYGKLIGKMHNLSKRHASPVELRPHWNSSSLGGDLAEMIPEGQKKVRSRIAELENDALALPATPDSYGLVHYDAHGGNMLVSDKGLITLFDFDDCCYSWYANDIAIILFYMVTNAKEPEALAVQFLEPFFRGYAMENKLDPVWLKSISLFLSLREIDLYAVIHRSMDPENLHGWCAAYMAGRRERLEKGIPYLEMDFSRFAPLLK